MKSIQKINDILMRSMELVMSVLVFAMMFIIVLQIVCRLWFTPLIWSEEVARLFMIWVVFLGAAYLYNLPTNGHIVVDALLQVLPPKASNGIILVMKPVLVLFIIACCYYGYDLLVQTKNMTLVATKWPMLWYYGSVPLSMLLMLFFTLTQLLERREKKKTLEGAA